jgi:hypothetical protein
VPGAPVAGLTVTETTAADMGNTGTSDDMIASATTIDVINTLFSDLIYPAFKYHIFLINSAENWIEH